MEIEEIARQLAQQKEIVDYLNSEYAILVDEIETIKEKQRVASIEYRRLKQALVDTTIEDLN